MTDAFQSVYQRQGRTYGDVPSAELMAYVDQCAPMLRGRVALDLAAGLGRDALALAAYGLHVTAIDLSQTAIAKLREIAADRGLAAQIAAKVADLRTVDLPERRYAIIAATTAFDHILLSEFTQLLPRVVGALADDGAIYIEVHTSEDPGSPVGEGAASHAPVSETAGAIRHYFAPGELLHHVMDHLRVLRYEERREWDHTHGKPHKHGKAALLAVRPDWHPQYFGYPIRDHHP